MPPQAPLGYQTQIPPELLELLRQQMLREAAAPQRVPRPEDVAGQPPMTIATSPHRQDVGAIAHGLNLPTDVYPNMMPAMDWALTTGEKGPRAIQSFENARTPQQFHEATTDLAIATARPMLGAGSFLAEGLSNLPLSNPLAPVPAGAQTKLTPGREQRMEMERQRAEQAAKAAREQREQESELRRAEAAAAAQREQAAAAAASEREQAAAREAARLAAEKEQQAITRATEGRMLKRAEERRAEELGRRITFQETPFGEWWTRRGAGTLAPAAGGLLAGGAGATIGSPLWKSLLSGGAAGGFMSRVPDIGNLMVAPTLNPERQGAEAYVAEAPENDPFRQRLMQNLAAQPGQPGYMPEQNPTAIQARKNLDPTNLGSLIAFGGGAGEGAISALLGHELARAGARLTQYPRSFFNAASPGGPSVPPAGPQPAAPLSPAGGIRPPAQLYPAPPMNRIPQNPYMPPQRAPRPPLPPRGKTTDGSNAGSFRKRTPEDDIP